MRKASILIFSSVMLLFCSCSTIHLKDRKEKDKYLSSSSYDELNGSYNNLKHEATTLHKTLLSNFDHESPHNQKDLIVKVDTPNENTIVLSVVDNETVIDSLIIKGRYRRGYFKLRREWRSNFIAGPLLWVLASKMKYIGLSKENQLVIIDDGGGGTMFLVVFPIFAAGTGQSINEYERLD